MPPPFPEAVPVEKVREMLAWNDADEVHTIRQARGAGLLIGADWERAEVEEAINTYPVYLSEGLAAEMNHGLCLVDEVGPLFLETKPEPTPVDTEGEEAADGGAS